MSEPRYAADFQNQTFGADFSPCLPERLENSRRPAISRSIPDNPTISNTKCRVTLVHEGEDASAALAEAGFAETISIPVVLGEQPDLPGGILGNGITPNLTAVLETGPDDAADRFVGQ